MDTPCRIEFVRSQTHRDVAEGEVILEVAEDAGVSIPSICRGGTCGTCKVLVRSGQVEVDTLYALNKVQRAEGWILTCSARAVPGTLQLDV